MQTHTIHTHTPLKELLQYLIRLCNAQYHRPLTLQRHPQTPTLDPSHRPHLEGAYSKSPSDLYASSHPNRATHRPSSVTSRTYVLPVMVVCGDGTSPHSNPTLTRRAPLTYVPQQTLPHKPLSPLLPPPSPPPDEWLRVCTVGPHACNTPHRLASAGRLLSPQGLRSPRSFPPQSGVGCHPPSSAERSVREDG